MKDSLWSSVKFLSESLTRGWYSPASPADMREIISTLSKLKQGQNLKIETSTLSDMVKKQQGELVYWKPESMALNTLNQICIKAEGCRPSSMKGWIADR